MFEERRIPLMSALLSVATLLGSFWTLPASAGELVFWTWRQEDRTQYQELFKDFQKLNPDISVKFEAVEAQNYATTLSAALAAGRGPDVIHVRAYGALEQFAKAGYLQPLDRETIPELANFAAAALSAESLRADKKVYAVPFASQTFGLFINE